MDTYDSLLKKSVATDDPIENKIMVELFKLRHQNNRLQQHINQTSTWATIKKVEEWKPFDFYHYFCTKYADTYHKEYKVNGSLIRVYQRIESFVKGNSIVNADYRKFIDTAFERYFNSVNPPHVAYICSPRLYKHLMKKEARLTTSKDFYALDEQLEHENDQFENYVKYHGLYEYSAR